MNYSNLLHTVIPIFYGPKPRLVTNALFAMGMMASIAMLIYGVGIPEEAAFYVPFSRDVPAVVFAIIVAYIIVKMYARMTNVLTQKEKQTLYGYKNYRPGFVFGLFLFFWLFPLMRFGIETATKAVTESYANQSYLMHFKHRYYKVCPRYGPCHIRNERYFELDSENGNFDGKLLVNSDPTSRSKEELLDCEAHGTALLETEGWEYFCVLGEEPGVIRITGDGTTFNQERVQGYDLVASGRRNALRIDITQASWFDPQEGFRVLYQK